MTSGNPYKRAPHYFETTQSAPQYCRKCLLKEKAPVHISITIHEQEIYEKDVPEFKEGTRPEVEHLFKHFDEAQMDSTFDVGFICGILTGGMIAGAIWAIVLVVTG